MSLQLSPSTMIKVETPTELKRVLFANAKLTWMTGHRAMELYDHYMDRLPLVLKRTDMGLSYNTKHEILRGLPTMEVIPNNG